MRRFALSKAGLADRYNLPVGCGCAIGAPDTESAMKWLYELLTILDAKAASLMTLNGIMLATATLFLVDKADVTLFSKGSSLSSAVHFTTACSGVLSACSIILCLYVVGVRWPFLALVDGPAKETDDTHYDFRDEIYALQREVTRRQWSYISSWLISMLGSVAILIVAILVFFFGTAITAK